ncbi:hypothetical protein B0T22DRAFT_504329 [Podospora appendiculata]|uniref:Uncharacterized protein n=1 Tax=Podospora appendiculata TaxID=314037 RepID=A0AAE0XGH9_9PEZI|nr:hypothetical protein B0T22DRAFT_504329 [Podospora appendiculata]
MHRHVLSPEYSYESMNINLPASMTFGDMLDDASSASDDTTVTADANVEELTTQVAHWKLTPESSPDNTASRTQSRSTATELARTKRQLQDAKAEASTLRSQLAADTAQHSRLLHDIFELILDAIEIYSPYDDDDSDNDLSDTDTHPSNPNPEDLASAIVAHLSRIQTQLLQNKTTLASLRAETTAYKDELHRMTAAQQHTETVLRLVMAKYRADTDILEEAVIVANFRLDAAVDEANRTRAELICAGKQLAASAAMKIASAKLRAASCEEEVGRVRGEFARVVEALEGLREERDEVRDELGMVTDKRDQAVATLAQVQDELETANAKAEQARALQLDAASETALTLGKLGTMTVQLQDADAKLDAARREAEQSRALEAGARLCLRDARGQVEALEGRVLLDYFGFGV